MTDFSEESLSVVPLHQHTHFMKQCCDLVNEEWPRSETARMLSLSTSCDKLPTCLIMVTEDKQVIGHCKLTPIPSIPTSCFAESVVIRKSLRGKGLGKFLMQASEQYCKEILSLTTIHLSTRGQEKFYEKLGYYICEPISIYGNFLSPKKSPPMLRIKFSESNTEFKSPVPPPLPLLNNEQKSSKQKTFMVKAI